MLITDADVVFLRILVNWSRLSSNFAHAESN